MVLTRTFRPLPIKYFTLSIIIILIKNPSNVNKIKTSLFIVGDLKRVGNAIASHQLLDPNHQVMRENMEFFINEGTLDKDWL